MTAQSQSARPLGRLDKLRAIAVRGAMLALLWLGLNGADGKSWIIGGPVVLAAAWLSWKLKPATPSRWRARGLLPFAWYFTRESIRGGFDVARRAFRTNLPLAPAFVRFVPRLPSGGARLFFCGCVSLLPGTCVVRIEESVLHIHLLDDRGPWERELRVLEQRVAALFGVALQPAPEGGNA